MIYVKWDTLKAAFDQSIPEDIRNLHGIPRLPVCRCAADLHLCNEPGEDYTINWQAADTADVTKSVCVKVGETCRNLTLTYQQDIDCFCSKYDDVIESGAAPAQIRAAWQ